MDAKDLEQKAKEIIEMAEKSGVQQNYFFLTTFERYRVQLGVLRELEKTINEEGALVTKEYVKGRKNLYTNPAINAYNSTADGANRTVQTLLKIIKELGNEREDAEDDPLMKAINGGGGK